MRQIGIAVKSVFVGQERTSCSFKQHLMSQTHKWLNVFISFSIFNLLRIFPGLKTDLVSRFKYCCSVHSAFNYNQKNQDSYRAAIR